MQLKYIWFPLGAVLIWAGNTVISKMAAAVIAPEDISFYRWLLAAALMSPFLARQTWRDRARIRPHLGKIAVLGLLGMVLFQSLAYFAAATSSATSMGMIVSLMPLLTLLLSIRLLSEPPTVGTVAGGLVSLAGLSILIGRGHPLQLFEHGVVVGDLLMLLAAVFYGLYGVLLRRWALPLPTWQLLYMQVLTAVVLLFPGFVFGHHSPVNAENLPILLYAGIAASIISQFLWMRGVAHLGANRCSIFVNLMPVFTVIIAVAALDEELHGYHAVGGLITLAGVIMAQALKQRLALRARSD
ncbi:DMT family transporter [Herbaspirillum sp. WKF16]|jgi:drug/metabolite transporter (DMT)-like permease|uniref:DMT family transporter n=1 Tax=Herbaspirillum sp. WKF16 TaxID=3028312 RepID=UPI0023AA091A|nr:DMT family transporter [Herbaspirillum sp. WKF16]WDZ94868.1 DMT family transporter [Herbaspirillum sp. WKF16]